MSTISLLRDAVKRYVYNNSELNTILEGETDTADIEVQVDAAILTAANNAQRAATQFVDFAFLDTEVSVTLTSAGLDLDNLGDDGYSMKNVYHAEIVRSDGGTHPVKLTTFRDVKVKARIEQRLQSPGRYLKYDYEFLTNEPLLYVRGLWLNSSPPLESGSEVSLKLHGFRYPDAFTEFNDDTNWLLKNGFEYMMWSCVVEVNHMVAVFVPRQEGSVSPPERAKQAALENLIVANAQLENMYNG